MLQRDSCFACVRILILNPLPVLLFLRKPAIPKQAETVTFQTPGGGSLYLGGTKRQ